MVRVCLLGLGLEPIVLALVFFFLFDSILVLGFIRIVRRGILRRDLAGDNICHTGDLFLYWRCACSSVSSSSSLLLDDSLSSDPESDSEADSFSAATGGSCFWTAQMMLEYLHEHEAAARLMMAIETVTARGDSMPRDLGGQATTEEVMQAVCRAL